jgi:HprK-related kinase A
MSLQRTLACGAFNIGVSLPNQGLVDDLQQLYGDQLQADGATLLDARLSILIDRGVRRLYRPRAFFAWAGQQPFLPMPARFALPAMEWGINYCVARSFHFLLVIHAAVLSRNGEALLMPAPPGSGKSTLTAGLMSRGWKLLSDEFALIDPDSGRLLPFPRPINLKNSAIAMAKQRYPAIQFSAIYRGTHKGDIALLAPTAEQRCPAAERPVLKWVVLPRWQAGEVAHVAPFSPAQIAMQLAHNAFNYHLFGQQGFQLLCDLGNQAKGLLLTHDDLDGAMDALERAL